MDSVLDNFNCQTFTEQLHTRFKVHATPAPLTMELVEVEERNTSPRVEVFFLRFQGPPSPWLPQGIHRFEHEKLGAFEIFITAIGTDEKGLLYEAVFQRFRKDQK